MGGVGYSWSSRRHELCDDEVGVGGFQDFSSLA